MTEKEKREEEIKRAIAISTADGTEKPDPEILELMNQYINEAITYEELNKRSFEILANFKKG